MKYLKLFEDLQRMGNLSPGKQKKLTKLLSDINGESGVFSGSFSQDMASNNDFKYELKEILEELEEKGWTYEKMKSLVKGAGKDLNSFLVDNGPESSLADVLLYELSDGENMLSNIELDDWMNNNGEGGEIYVKYSYGWHRNHYGQMYLEQNGIDDLPTYMSERFFDIYFSMEVPETNNHKRINSMDYFEAQEININKIKNDMISCVKHNGGEFIITDNEKFIQVLDDNDLFTDNSDGYLDTLCDDMKTLGANIIKKENSTKIIF